MENFPAVCRQESEGGAGRNTVPERRVFFSAFPVEGGEHSGGGIFPRCGAFSPRAPRRGARVSSVPQSGAFSPSAPGSGAVGPLYRIGPKKASFKDRRKIRKFSAK